MVGAGGVLPLVISRISLISLNQKHSGKVGKIDLPLYSFLYVVRVGLKSIYANL